MSTQYVSHKFDLSDDQRRRLSKGAPITLRFSNSKLSGNNELYVTQTIKNRIEKLKAQGKGTTVRFTESMIRANRSGGSLLALVPQALSFVSSLQAPETTSKIDRMFARLHGKGANDDFLKGVLQGIQNSGTPQGEGIRTLGSGIEGSGAVKDFFDGFLYGLNPLNWPKMLGLGIPQLDELLKGKGVLPLGQGVRPLGRGVRPLGSGVRPLGSGIKFY